MLYKDARLASWRIRALAAAMKLMFKFKRFSVDFNDGSGNNTMEHRVTRSTLGPTFNLAHPNSTRYLKSTAYLLRTEWNNLPYSYRHFEDYELFKLSISNFYKEKLESMNTSNI